MILSLARPGDVLALLEHLMTYQGENPPSRQILAAGLAQHVARCPVLLVRAPGGPIAGSMGLRRFRWLWSGRAYLMDDWTYAPGGGAVQLVRGARAVARRAGVPFYWGQSSGERPEAVRRLARRLGGRDMGGLYRFID